MRTSKDIFTQVFKDLILDDNTLRAMQLRLLDAAEDIHFVCQKYNLTYFLDAGTLLGAIRHKGFIPWDDDIDLIMPLEDYNKIGECITAEFGDKYIVKYQHSDLKDPTSCLKIYINNTVYQELISADWEKPQMLFVDIFALRSAPNSKFVRKIKGTLVDIAVHCASLKAEYKYPSKILLDRAKQDKNLAKYLKARRRYSAIANIMPMKFWYKMCDRLLKKQYPNSDYYAMPEGVSYNKVIKKGVFADSIDVEFEGKIFKGPKRYEDYLIWGYGASYMELPPEEKRERHIAVKIDF